MRDSNLTSWSTEGIDDLVFEVLRELGVDEVEREVSEIYSPMVIELAKTGDVMPIDTRDPSGGFGGVDLWLATVVPALAAVLGLRRNGQATPHAVEAAIKDVIGRVGSPRAKRHQADLIRVVGARLFRP